jgi:hypothetical protein
VRRDQLRVTPLEPCLPGHHALLVSWLPSGEIVTAPTSGPGEAEALVVKLRELVMLLVEEPGLIAKVAGADVSEGGAK